MKFDFIEIGGVVWKSDKRSQTGCAKDFYHIFSLKDFKLLNCITNQQN